MNDFTLDQAIAGKDRAEKINQTQLFYFRPVANFRDICRRFDEECQGTRYLSGHILLPHVGIPRVTGGRGRGL